MEIYQIVNIVFMAELNSNFLHHVLRNHLKLLSLFIFVLTSANRGWGMKSPDETHSELEKQCLRHPMKVCGFIYSTELILNRALDYGTQLVLHRVWKLLKLCHRAQLVKGLNLPLAFWCWIPLYHLVFSLTSQMFWCKLGLRPALGVDRSNNQLKKNWCVVGGLVWVSVEDFDFTKVLKLTFFTNGLCRGSSPQHKSVSLYQCLFLASSFI